MKTVQISDNVHSILVDKQKEIYEDHKFTMKLSDLVDRILLDNIGSTNIKTNQRFNKYINKICLAKFDNRKLLENAENLQETISINNCTMLDIILEYKSEKKYNMLEILKKLINVIEIKKYGTQMSFKPEDLMAFNNILHENISEHGFFKDLDTGYCQVRLNLPLSPIPFSPLIGFKDASVVVHTNNDQSGIHDPRLTIEALVHTEPPKYQLQMYYWYKENFDEFIIDLHGDYLIGLLSKSDSYIHETNYRGSLLNDNIKIKDFSMRPCDWLDFGWSNLDTGIKISENTCLKIEAIGDKDNSMRLYPVILKKT